MASFVQRLPATVKPTAATLVDYGQRASTSNSTFLRLLNTLLTVLQNILLHYVLLLLLFDVLFA